MNSLESFSKGIAEDSLSLDRKSIVLIASTIVIGLIGLSVNALAQTSNIVPLDNRNHYGQFSINNVRVSEKQFYKVIFMDVHVQVKDLGLKDSTTILPYSITIVNKNGKTYSVPPLQEECTRPTWGVDIYGNKGGVGTYSTCFRVDKEFNNFKVYYSYNGVDSKSHSYPIGNVDLNQSSLAHAKSGVKQTNLTKAQNFFKQFYEMIKNLFKFS